MASIRVYYHLPGAETLMYTGRSFPTRNDAEENLASVVEEDDQYVAVLEDGGKVFRYLVTKGCGKLEVIPEHTLGSISLIEKAGNIFNFAMGDIECPLMEGEGEF
jgi:hypothetical protein